MIPAVLLAGCTASAPSGSYNGTLTVTLTGGPVVETTLANIQPDQDNVELFSMGSSTLHCALQGTSWSDSVVHFDCATHQCFCTASSDDLTVTTASGTLSGDLLSLTFAGEVSTTTSAFSATFMGTLVPGSR